MFTKNQEIPYGRCMKHTVFVHSSGKFAPNETFIRHSVLQTVISVLRCSSLPVHSRGHVFRLSSLELACEQALWSEKERRKQRARTSAPSFSPVYARLASPARLFSCFFPTAEPVHRLFGASTSNKLSALDSSRTKISHRNLHIC